jgi:DNA replication and repair protein RecF
LKLQTLLIESFRNHKSSLLQCSQGINLLLGNNGEGKTNILESISYICLTNSFYATNDVMVTKIGEAGFIVKGEMLSDGGVTHEVHVLFDKEQNQKTITTNKRKIEKSSMMIGKFPLVVLSQEQSTVTLGSPADRRRFVDLLISQTSRAYLENLIDYRKILKQRNKALSDIQSTDKRDVDTIEPWNESLIRTGAMVIKKRKEFISDFQNIMIDSYAQLAGIHEKPRISYAPSFEYDQNDTETIMTKFARELQDRFSEERRIGYSLVGPHRDEFIFQINDLNARGYASQGQHKTYLIALKIAEYYYLKNLYKETPILLLDDVLSELDGKRSQRLLELLSGFGQVFITSTDERNLDLRPIADTDTRKFFITQGRIERVENAERVH